MLRRLNAHVPVLSKYSQVTSYDCRSQHTLVKPYAYTQRAVSTRQQIFLTVLCWCQNVDSYVCEVVMQGCYAEHSMCNMIASWTAAELKGIGLEIA